MKHDYLQVEIETRLLYISLMWLVQLYKAKDNVTIEGGIYETTSCEAERIGNFIDLQDYESELRLCYDWEYNSKKKILILSKQLGEISLSGLQNERFMDYRYEMFYNYKSAFSYITLVEYWEDTDFFIDFYVFTQMYVQFSIPYEITTSANPIMSFLQYIKGKTLKVGIVGSETPKYSFVFDNNCKYYHIAYEYGIHVILAIRSPFLVGILLFPSDGYFLTAILIKPKLIEEFNDCESGGSTYNPDGDRPLKVSEIIDHYFNSNTKEGLSYNGVNINDEWDNGFSYNLIRGLLGTFKHDIYESYYFSLDNEIGTLHPEAASYMSLVEKPLCIYFPLFRPQLDNSGFTSGWPQYDPNDMSKYVYTFYWFIQIQNDGQIEYSLLNMQYGYSPDSSNRCYDYLSGQMPAWRSDTCDYTRPFRFVGDTNCEAMDDWAINAATHNANYLFKIVKPANSESYNIKGVGCGELITEITNFSDFSAEYTFQNGIYAEGINEIQRITFSERGYPIEDISNALASCGISSNETCFVLFNESLLDDENDFRSIYQAVTVPLPNAIVCYVGDSEKIPDTHKNKVIHSNAIVTDLDTSEQMPLVIKYIKYAKRLHKLFNE